MLRKGIISLGVQFIIVLALIGATVWAGNNLKDQTPKDIYAAGGTASLYFSPAMLILPGSGATQLILKTETTNDKIGAVNINISFDPTKIKLANEVFLGTALPQVLPGNTTMAQANSTGTIVIHTGTAPGSINGAPTGTIVLATLNWVSATTGTNVSALVSINTSTSTVADITPQYLPIIAQSLNININPVATATPTTRPTNTPTIRPSVTVTPSLKPTSIPTIIPSATPTTRPTSTPTTRPTSTPTTRPTNTPVVTTIPPSPTSTPTLMPTITIAMPTITPVVGDNGLVAAYGFEEGTGNTVKDYSGKGNNGVVQTPIWSDYGKFGHALRFGAYENRVVIPDSSNLDVVNGMTLEAWIKPATTLSGWRSVIVKEQVGELVYGLYASGDANETYGVVYINGAQVVVHGVNMASGIWNHVATTYDGRYLKQYVNGVLVSSRSLSGGIKISTEDLSIGGNSIWPEEVFPGLIDEVRIYNRALSSVEIGVDMNKAVSGTVVVPTGTVGTPSTATYKATQDKTIFRYSGNTIGIDKLRVDGSPVANFLVKFVISGLENKQVISSKLRLYNWDSSYEGGKVYTTINNWSDSTLTWSNAPAAYNLLGSLKWAGPSRWYEVDVTRFVIGSGTYSFRVTSPAFDGATYSSIEGGYAPVLQITYR